MPKYRQPPLSGEAIWDDGPPVRVRDLVAITGLCADTIYQDITAGELRATKRHATSPFLIERTAARRWLVRLGMGGARAMTRLTAGTQPNLQPPIYSDPSAFMQSVRAELMGLATILRNAVATAHQVTGATDGLQAAVTHRAWIANDGYGKPSYDEVTLTAIVERKQRLITTAGGQEVLSRTRLTILQPVTANGAEGRAEPIDPRDVFLLPDGSAGRVLDVQGPVDPSSGVPFCHEVYLG